ncbi:MAG TPA: GDP-mannose 4,6-dehydratase [Candidatus Saccharimonadales bacterium]|nr:GDP-mannose 4,6-dehydratase [Candidatus Saccharimonadales bacterium]
MAEAQKRALVTGITGQDGMYLAELLLSKNYKVYGLLRGQHNPKRGIVEAELPDVELLEGDLTDIVSLIRVLKIAQPDEVYNLGAWSYVRGSYDEPFLTAQVSGVGVLNLLEAIRITGGTEKVRFYQASTSEMFGKVHEVPQKETTLLHPRSPYGNAKAFAHYTTINYRESYGMFTATGTLFNHESPRRGHEFVTRKVTTAVARIKLGLQDKVALGNLDAKRDWGFAGDYVEGMWLMLQQDEPDDYVLATGETHSIRELLDVAFKEIGIDDWEPYVDYDKNEERPAEVDLLLGDPTKAKEKLGWEPKVTFEELIKMMVKSDLEIEGRKKRQAEVA